MKVELSAEDLDVLMRGWRDHDDTMARAKTDRSKALVSAVFKEIPKAFTVLVDALTKIGR